MNASNIKKGVVVGRNGGNSSNSIVGTFSGYTRSGSKTGSNSTTLTISGQSWGFTPNRIVIYCNQTTAISDIAFFALRRDNSTVMSMCSGTSNSRTFYNNAISFSNISASGFKATCPSSKKFSSSVTYYYLVWREE